MKKNEEVETQNILHLNMEDVFSFFVCVPSVSGGREGKKMNERKKTGLLRDKVLELVARLVGGGKHVERAVVVEVVVDAVAVGEGRGHDAVEEANPPVEEVAEVGVVGIIEQAQPSMALLVAHRVF